MRHGGFHERQEVRHPSFLSITDYLTEISQRFDFSPAEAVVGWMAPKRSQRHHVNYFTPKTLKKLAHEAGFQVSSQNILDRFPLSDNMYATLSKCSRNVP